MKCQNIVERISEFLDNRLPEETARELVQHLRVCRRCDRRYQSMHRIHATLRGLPASKAPARLSVSLRVMASKERQRLVRMGTWRGRLATWLEEARFATDNMMRPFALPAAGGLASAVMLFAMLMPSIAPRANSAVADVPTVLFTDASLNRDVDEAMYAIRSLFDAQGEITIDIDLDEGGRVIDYEVVSGHSLMRDARLRRSIENNLLFAQFKPATAFGQPKTGRLRISFRPATYVDVKG